MKSAKVVSDSASSLVRHSALPGGIPPGNQYYWAGCGLCRHQYRLVGARSSNNVHNGPTKPAGQIMSNACASSIHAALTLVRRLRRARGSDP